MPDLPASPTGHFPGAEVYLPLTPDEIRKHALPDARFASRGYSKPQVNVLLHRIAREVDQRNAELARAQAAAAQYARRADDLWHEAGGDGPAPLPEVSDQALQLLNSAQHQADRLVDDARQEAHQIVVDGQEEAERVIAEAHEAADRAARDYWARVGPQGTGAGEAKARQEAWLLTALSGLDGVRHYLDSVINAIGATLGPAAAAVSTAAAMAAGPVEPPTSVEDTRPLSADYIAQAAGNGGHGGPGSRGSGGAGPGWRP
jgi:DivIVA domain-containing protein